MIGHITRATRHLLFWSLIAIALLLTAARVFLASLDNYQLELEQKIRHITETPIRIGKLEAGMRGFNPEVILREISVEADDSKAKPDIQLREIRLGIDFWTLLRRQDWLSSTRVTLVGAKVSITRNIDGNFSIKGLQASDEPPVWLLSGGKYEILDSQISWQDLKRHGDQVHFDHIDFVLKNHYGGRSHEVHLVSDLPKQYGDSLRISALITGNIAQGKDIGGQLYIEGTDLQASALVTGDLPFGLILQSGAGDIRVWSLWRDSNPYQIDGYIQAQQISISKNQGPPLQMDTFQANFSWSNNEDRWRLAGYDVNIYTQRQRWPEGSFYLQQDVQGDLSAIIKQLDLPAAMFLAPLFVPVEHTYADWLKLNPKGRLRDVSVFVSNDFDNYAVRGRFDGLSVDSFGAIPQILNLSGEISANNRYGQIILDTHDALAKVDELFRNAINIKRVQGSVHWWQTHDAWQFYSRNLVADSTEFKTVTDFNLLISKAGASPVLDMRTRFGEFTDISQVHRYLPAKIMNEGAVEWLDDAFVAGQINRGEMVIEGALDQFPFARGQGRFETVFTIENGEFQFNQDWPHLRDLYADVQFLRNDLQVAIWDGRSEQVEIDQAVVTMPDLADGEYVYVWGQLNSKIMNAFGLLEKSPLKEKIDPIVNLIDAKGSTRVDLELKIPYELEEPAQVNVNASLNGAELTLKPINLKVDGIKGVLKFTEDRIGSGPLNARALGYSILGELNSDDDATYLKIDGDSDIEHLENQFTFLQNDSVTGEFSYHAKLTLPYSDERPGLLDITSSLKGVNINGLAHLEKTAPDEIPLHLNFEFDNAALMPLQVSYGNRLQAFLLVDKNRDRLYSGNIVIGQGRANRYNNAGITIDIKQPTFNLSDAIGGFSASDESSLPPLREITIDTENLLWGEQELGAMHCQVRRVNQTWDGIIDSSLAKGRFRIPDKLSGNDHMRFDMEYWNLTGMEKMSFAGVNNVTASSLPLIDLNSEKLLWHSVNLGSLQLQTERLSKGIHFKTIRVQNDKGIMDLTGDWLEQPSGTSTQIRGNLKMDHFGRLLSQLRVTDDFKETSANIDVNGEWTGGPHQFSMDRLNGQIRIELRDGRISSIEPGFGRLLGLIAMEQWVKRLSLDFSDIYREGLAFDSILGNFKIKNGLAFTNDLSIDAMAATFNIAGFTNLVNKTINQRVAVIPKSSDAVPIAGTIVGGIASIITQAVTDDYKEGYFFGSQYQLTGKWNNVEVTPLHEEDGLLNKTWRGLTEFDWLDSITK
ncbi:YhdP family protein [Methylomonas sp. MgM2]